MFGTSLATHLTERADRLALSPTLGTGDVVELQLARARSLGLFAREKPE